MKQITPRCGEHISTVAETMLVARSLSGEEVSATFNEVVVTTEHCLSAEDIVSQYDAKSTRRHDEWLASPEGIAYTQKQHETQRKLQNEADACMSQLKTLDFSKDVDVIDWLLKIREPSDYTSVTINTAEIIRIFTENGFCPNVNCGADFKPEDRENSYLYLVGQALDGLMQIGAIHQIFHKFADQWKSKFVNT